MNSIALEWIIIVSIWISVTASTQDFRDIKGDRTTGRKTIPIVYGEKQGRIIMAILFVIMGIFIALSIRILVEGRLSIPIIVCIILLTCWHLLLSYRLIYYKSSTLDHKTYMLHTYLYCALLVSGFLII